MINWSTFKIAVVYNSYIPQITRGYPPKKANWIGNMNVNPYHWTDMVIPSLLFFVNNLQRSMIHAFPWGILDRTVHTWSYLIILTCTYLFVLVPTCTICRGVFTLPDFAVTATGLWPMQPQQTACKSSKITPILDTLFREVLRRSCSSRCMSIFFRLSNWIRVLLVC